MGGEGHARAGIILGWIAIGLFVLMFVVGMIIGFASDSWSTVAMIPLAFLL